MQSSLAIGQIDICLLPEVPFNLHGPHGVLSHLKYLIESKGSTVVCVAEGARQEKLNKYDNEDGTSRSVQEIQSHMPWKDDIYIYIPKYKT
ncbi:ATP-dependent 6-phosphofructokinase [Trifolium repens]|nr:ATP-dependent 6-phosphofructokinase [Trifolium repens]